MHRHQHGGRIEKTRTVDPLATTLQLGAALQRNLYQCIDTL
jgi:hypothetical protein